MTNATDRPRTGIVVSMTTKRLEQIMKLSQIWNETLNETICEMVDDYLDNVEWRREELEYGVRKLK